MPRFHELHIINFISYGITYFQIYTRKHYTLTINNTQNIVPAQHLYFFSLILLQLFFPVSFVTKISFSFLGNFSLYLSST